MNEFDRNPGMVPPVDPSTEPAKPVPLHHGMVVRLRNYFLTGLVLVGPAYITIGLTWWFINWVDDLVRPFIPLAYRPETYLPVKVPGFGLIIAFLALTLLGFLTANLVGRTFVEIGEMILERVPIVRPIYRGLKQVFETLFSKSASSFRTVGLVEFPAPGMWSLVFLSTPPGADLTAQLPSDDEYVSAANRMRRALRVDPLRAVQQLTNDPCDGDCFLVRGVAVCLVRNLDDGEPARRHAIDPDERQGIIAGSRR